LVSVLDVLISVTLLLPLFAIQMLPIASTATPFGVLRPPPEKFVPVSPDALISVTVALLAIQAFPLTSTAMATGRLIEPTV
jgi:hypothetical protein